MKLAPPIVRSSTSRQWVAEGFFVVLAPIAAFFALHICLINQDGSVDPWLYTGYGKAFKILQELSGWLYYNVRFPVVLLNLAVSKELDPVVGFGILRYLIVLTSGVPLYLWARHHFGLVYAIAAYLFLFFNPLFPRTLAWDLTPFVSVPMALAGIALWQIPTKFPAASRALSGFAFCASVASHAFTGTAIALFFLVEAAFRLIKRQYSDLILLDIAAPIVGAAVCFAIGMVAYYMIVGPYDPSVFITVTLNVIRSGDKYGLTHNQPASIWIWSNVNIFAPLVLVAFVALGFTRDVARDNVISRVWWFGLLYYAAYAAYQFLFHRDVLQTFYYFFHLTVVVYLLFPVCLYLLTRGLTRRGQAIAVGAAIAMLIATPSFRSYFIIGPSAIKETITGFELESVGGVILIGVAICCIRFVTKAASVILAYAVALVFSVQFLALAAPSFAQVYSNPHQGREYDVYRAAAEMLGVFGRYATPSDRVALWCALKEISTSRLAIAAYPNSINQYYEGVGLPDVGAYERSRLGSSDLKYVMILAQEPQLIAEGKEALTRNGYQFRDVENRTIGGATYSANLDLVELIRPAVGRPLQHNNPNP